MESFKTINYYLDDEVPGLARLILNRPDKYNAIDMVMPHEILMAVNMANANNLVHVILIEGNGKGFCGGYDLAGSSQYNTEHPCQQESYPWEPIIDFHCMKSFTDAFMSLWESPKVTVAKIHGFAVAGGSDIALCCDLLVMADDARIGYMPSRVWGCPTTAMWAYKLGITRAKELLFTGELIDGQLAYQWGLSNLSVPADDLDQATINFVKKIVSVPKGQLTMHKMVLNQMLEHMGLLQAQRLATIFDGISRHNPEGLWFRRHSQTYGFKSAVDWRDSGKKIPESDEAREYIKQYEAILKNR